MNTAPLSMFQRPLLRRCQPVGWVQLRQFDQFKSGRFKFWFAKPPWLYDLPNYRPATVVEEADQFFRVSVHDRVLNCLATYRAHPERLVKQSSFAKFVPHFLLSAASRRNMKPSNPAVRQSGARRVSYHHVPLSRGIADQLKHVATFVIRASIFGWKEIAGNRIMAALAERLPHNPTKLAGNKNAHYLRSPFAMLPFENPPRMPML